MDPAGHRAIGSGRAAESKLHRNAERIDDHDRLSPSSA
jgi:hypothetical protein